MDCYALGVMAECTAVQADKSVESNEEQANKEAHQASTSCPSQSSGKASQGRFGAGSHRDTSGANLLLEVESAPDRSKAADEMQAAESLLNNMGEDELRQRLRNILHTHPLMMPFITNSIEPEQAEPVPELSRMALPLTADGLIPKWKKFDDVVKWFWENDGKNGNKFILLLNAQENIQHHIRRKSLMPTIFFIHALPKEGGQLLLPREKQNPQQIHWCLCKIGYTELEKTVIETRSRIRRAGMTDVEATVCVPISTIETSDFVRNPKKVIDKAAGFIVDKNLAEKHFKISVYADEWILTTTEYMKFVNDEKGRMKKPGCMPFSTDIFEDKVNTFQTHIQKMLGIAKFYEIPIGYIPPGIIIQEDGKCIASRTSSEGASASPSQRASPEQGESLSLGASPLQEASPEYCPLTPPTTPPNQKSSTD